VQVFFLPPLLVNKDEHNNFMNLFICLLREMIASV